MHKSKAVNSASLETDGEFQENPDTTNNAGAFYNHRRPSGTRSKSINGFKAPIKAYPSTISNLKKVSNLPNTDRRLASEEEPAINRLDSPRVAQKSVNGIPTSWEKMSQKAESFSPQKMYGNSSQNKKQLLRPVDVSKIQVKGIESYGNVPSRLYGNSQQETSSQGYYPIRALNNYTLKPITLNKDLTSKHKISNAYELPTMRSRKGQFVMQNPGERSFTKKNTLTDQSRIAEFNIGSQAMTERRETTQQNEETSSLKLPKLDVLHVPKHRSDGNLAPGLHQLNGKQPINNLDLAHKRQITESSISTDRTSRSKIRSLEKTETSKTKSLKAIAEGPRNTLGQPLSSARRNSPNHSHDLTSIKSREELKREPSPLPSRNLSVSNIKNSQTFSSINLQEKDKVVVNTFAVKTQAGYLPGKGVKTNQDSFILHTNFAGSKDKYFFAVCDGHGQNGHLVSNFIKQRLPRNVESHYKTLRDENLTSIKEMLTKTFLKTNRDLTNASIDINFSGTTTVSVLISNSRIWCANIGDSRAIIAKCINSEWTAHPLSRDHKPDEPSEKERIIASGGRVDSFKDAYGDPLGPNRVWLKDEDLPGLAMARSFGDGVAALAGVIAEPEIMQFDLEKEDKFIIIASDGVWEFLSNKQVMDMVVPFYMRNELEPACDKVIREATTTWKLDGEIIDDITCLIISLKSTTNK